MSHLGRIEVFLEVARLQSFTLAGRALRMTGPAVSKQIAALEDDLGVKLLNRTTRRVALTEEGALYFERTRTAIEELKDAAAHIQDLKAMPTGKLRISAPLSFGHMHLLPTLSGFAKKFPDITMEVVLDDRQVDLLTDNFDLVIRIGLPTDTSLITKHLSDCPIFLVASPEYLARKGTPVIPKDLTFHRFISYSLQGGSSEWCYKGPDKKTGAFQTEGIFKANTAEMMLQATLDGVGISLLPHFSVDSYLKAGKLVRVLADYKTDPPRSIFVLMPPNRFRATKVKLFIEWLGEACKAMPWYGAKLSS